jgi:hypothetical protein
MSLFYVLPSRPVLGRQFAEILGVLFPGLNWTEATWPDLAEILGSMALAHQDVFVVYREELPEGVAPAEALAAACGAELGDEVIEVLPNSRLSEVEVRRWRLEEEGKAA